MDQPTEQMIEAQMAKVVPLPYVQEDLKKLLRIDQPTEQEIEDMYQQSLMAGAVRTALDAEEADAEARRANETGAEL